MLYWKKNSKKKTEEIIMKKALCRAEGKKNSVNARFDQLLTGYDYVKKMKRWREEKKKKKKDDKNRILYDTIKWTSGWLAKKCELDFAGYCTT